MGWLGAFFQFCILAIPGTSAYAEHRAAPIQVGLESLVRDVGSSQRAERKNIEIANVKIQPMHSVARDFTEFSFDFKHDFWEVKVLLDQRVGGQNESTSEPTFIFEKQALVGKYCVCHVNINSKRWRFPEMPERATEIVQGFAARGLNNDKCFFRLLTHLTGYFRGGVSGPSGVLGFNQRLPRIDQRSGDQQYAQSSQECYPKGLGRCISSGISGGLLGEQIAPVRYLLTAFFLALSGLSIFIGAKGFERIADDEPVAGFSVMALGLVLLLVSTGLVTGNI